MVFSESRTPILPNHAIALFLDKALRVCSADFRSALQEDVFQLFGTNVADACLSGSAPQRIHWYVWHAYRFTMFYPYFSLRRYNGSIYVYGQTGSGKTYTMQGAVVRNLRVWHCQFNLFVRYFKKAGIVSGKPVTFNASIWRTLSNQCTTTKKGSGKRTLPTCCSMYFCSVLWIFVDVDRLVLWTQGAWCAGYWT